VSPLWRDELAIFVSPRRIALARRACGLKARLTAAAEVAVVDGSGSDAIPAFTRLAQILTEPTWQDAAVRVVVANVWARFGMVPAPASRLDDAARRAHARYVLGDTYGEGIADWQVALEDAAPGRTSAACALPRDVMAALEGALAPARLKLISVQPCLVVAFNAWRRSLPRGDLWFIALEEGWVSAVEIIDGVWHRIHAARMPSDSNVEFERMQALARLARGPGSGARIFVEAPPALRARAQRIGSDIEWLAAEAPDGGPAHELALLRRACA
jgi:hypothetical protein